MWVVNNQKAQAQTFLKYDMQNLMTQLNSEERMIDGIISSINRSVGGLPSGYDVGLIDRCREAKSSLEEARRLLSTCNDCISQLEVQEWLPDE